MEGENPTEIKPIQNELPKELQPYNSGICDPYFPHPPSTWGKHSQYKISDAEGYLSMVKVQKRGPLDLGGALNFLNRAIVDAHELSQNKKQQRNTHP